MPSSFTNKDAGKVMLRPRGVYNPEATYEPLDMVSYQGASYVAVIEVTNVTPPNDTYWHLATESYTDEHFNIASRNPVANDEVTWAINGIRDALRSIGIKNLLDPGSPSGSKTGLTYSTSNGIIRVDGTSTSDGYLALVTNGGITLGPGKYHFSGCPSDGGVNRFYLRLDSISGDTIDLNDYGEGFDFVLNNRTSFNLEFVYATNLTFDNLELRPMVTYTFDTESDYNHFVPSNKGAIITVDDEIDRYSTNPVQNKVIYQYIDDMIVSAVNGSY